MFKIGDEVVCIDDSFDSSVTNFGNDSYLTYGKVYEVIDVFPLWDGVRTLDDHNKFNDYLAERFVSQETFRRIKLDKICSKLEIK